MVHEFFSDNRFADIPEIPDYKLLLLFYTLNTAAYSTVQLIHVFFRGAKNILPGNNKPIKFVRGPDRDPIKLYDSQAQY